MSFLQALLIFVSALFLLYFALSALYFFIFSFAALFYRESPRALPEKHKPGVVVLLPAYKEDAVILDSAAKALKHTSVSADMSVCVIADSLQKETLKELDKMGVNLIPVSFEKSTKAKSLRVALAQIDQNTDYVLVLDADNVMEEGFLDAILLQTINKYKIVQGHRSSKNLNTNMAVLDSISEEVNNSIFRMGHRVLGLSASLIGSGFICEFPLFKELINASKAVGGFDKELELMLLARGIRIGYARKAVVRDEKVQRGEVFVNQRRRWLSAQFVYLSGNILRAFRLLLSQANLDFFDKVVQFMLPPRVLALGAGLILFAVHGLWSLLAASHWPGLLFAAWGMAFGITALAVLLAIPRKLYSRNMLVALMSLPSGFLLTLVALFRSRGANKTFIHTQHGLEQENKEKK